MKPERLARASMQPAPSTRLLEELEVGTGRLSVSRGEQGGQLSLVNGSREVTLGKLLGNREPELVRGWHSEVILGASGSDGRPGQAVVPVKLLTFAGCRGNRSKESGGGMLGGQAVPKQACFQAAAVSGQPPSCCRQDYGREAFPRFVHNLCAMLLAELILADGRP